MRLIIQSEPTDYILAVRAAKWLLDDPRRTDAIVVYGEGSNKRCFYVKRNKASVSVRAETRES